LNSPPSFLKRASSLITRSNSRLVIADFIRLMNATAGSCPAFVASSRNITWSPNRLPSRKARQPGRIPQMGHGSLPAGLQFGEQAGRADDPAPGSGFERIGYLWGQMQRDEIFRCVDRAFLRVHRLNENPASCLRLGFELHYR
jgi:hypothetical protein